MLADVNDAQGNALSSELGAATSFVRTDVTDEASAKAAVAAAQSAFGMLHGLINCAGIAIGERVVGKEGPHALASFARTININLIGSFNMMRLAGESMAQRAQRRRRARRSVIPRRWRRTTSDRSVSVQRVEGGPGR
jgi:NAD(P)-dependent dehydrogenase (short-subunit alcohol dehydrogenase family)